MTKILIVDDEWEIRKTLEYFLDKLGYQAILAGNADEALVKIKTDPPALILLDYFLPGLSGQDLIDVIRQEVSQTPIFIMTGSDQVTQLKDPATIGVDRIIAKPFELDDLEAKIRQAVPLK